MSIALYLCERLYWGVYGESMNTKRIQIVLTIVGIMAFALMVVGCGDGSREAIQSKNPVDGLQTDLDQAQIFEGATHVLTGNLVSITEPEFRFIAAPDYTGTRTSEPKIQIVVKVTPQGIIEKSDLIIKAADQLGEFKYEAECQAQQYRGVNMGCGFLRPGYFVASLKDKLPNSYGFIEFVSDGGTGGTLQGKAVLDNHSIILGRFQLTVKEVDHEITN